MVTDTLGGCVRSPSLDTGTSCWEAPDGKVCISFVTPDAPVVWYSGTADLDLGILFLQNGAGARVRYADWGLFDGTPLPTPTTCPTLQNARICGANCGGCAPNEICHGRSPLHPYGFCISAMWEVCNVGSPKCSNASADCLSFKVQPEAQALADRFALLRPEGGVP